MQVHFSNENVCCKVLLGLWLPQDWNHYPFCHKQSLIQQWHRRCTSAFSFFLHWASIVHRQSSSSSRPSGLGHLFWRVLLACATKTANPTMLSFNIVLPPSFTAQSYHRIKDTPPKLLGEDLLRDQRAEVICYSLFRTVPPSDLCPRSHTLVVRLEGRADVAKL